MAGKYTKQELKEKLNKSTFQVVMTEGIENLTVRKVAKGCGLSDPYIYQVYSDIPELLEDAFFNIDEQIAGFMSEAFETNTIPLDKPENVDAVCWKIWKAYWDFLMEDPERTVFYWRYQQSAYYKLEMTVQRFKNFASFSSFAFEFAKTIGYEDKENFRIVLSNIIDETVMIAFKIHLGYIDANSITPRGIYESMFALMFHRIGQSIWGKE